MKFKALILALVLAVSLLAGCSPEEKPSDGTDVVSSASVVTDEESLLNAISEDGTWIILFTEDITVDEELVLEGQFTNDGEPDRKIALYEQDEDRNKTASYTLTAPRLTVESENTRIQGGTFVGDVYVQANGFTVRDATIEGNVYFENEEYMSTFELGEGATVTGVTEVEGEDEDDTDVVSSASTVTDEQSLLNAISENGTWIVMFTEDISTNKNLTVEGEFTNRGEVARKLALYEQDDDRNKTASYTLTAPSLTIKSENTRLQGGTFVGDVYVEANGFTIRDATVDGNVYFANEEYKSTFELGEGGNVTGNITMESTK